MTRTAQERLKKTRIDHKGSLWNIRETRVLGVVSPYDGGWQGDALMRNRGKMNKSFLHRYAGLTAAVNLL
jgi:hypothetical protein